MKNLTSIIASFCLLFIAMTSSSKLLASMAHNEAFVPIPKASDLKDNQLLEIGIKIWQNQCDVWDKPGVATHEMKRETTDWEDNYALIGIGQCIWYPANEDKRLQEDWPHVAQALKEKGYPIEDWMLTDCPWNSREEFMADFNGDRLTSLRKILTKRAVLIEQARCIATRLDESLDKISASIDGEALFKRENQRAFLPSSNIRL
jgi:hypothetical protein